MVGISDLDVSIPDGFQNVSTFQEFYRPDQISSIHPTMVPQTFYKYRAWRALDDTEQFKFHRAFLIDNALAFPSVQTFNDPFDSGVMVRFDLSTPEYIANWKKSLVESMKPKSRAEREHLEDVTKRIGVEEMNKVASDANWQHVGICSFAERRDNLLMWAHYSDCHRGICVGFDAYELQRHLHNYSMGIRAYRIHHAKMQYTLEVPEINPEDGMEDVRMLQVYCHKHEDWSYEEEHRLIYQSNPRTGSVYPGRCIVKPFKDEHITEVIIGLNNTFDEEIIDIVKRKESPIRVFKARKNPRKFEIDLEELSY